MKAVLQKNFTLFHELKKITENFTTTKPLHGYVVRKVRIFSFYFWQKFMELIKVEPVRANEVYH